ncbi:hypothetical protein Pint_34740 [Pistacia integerrima]|uniref:Uncharacterized protein n=1 Tax=Pistacia integerrima TaxID=434235 RepID=A0ACC0X611_9ROSI|nr:hypothetical protein Pint_34740 [Pistacia integerrima]
MELKEILHMNRGEGETSYANNSLIQVSLLSLTQIISEIFIADVLQDPTQYFWSGRSLTSFMNRYAQGTKRVVTPVLDSWLECLELSMGHSSLTIFFILFILLAVFNGGLRLAIFISSVSPIIFTPDYDYSSCWFLEEKSNCKG